MTRVWLKKIAAPILSSFVSAPETIAGLIWLVVALMVGIIAIGRYAFNTGWPGVEESAMILFLWGLFLGAAAAVRKGSHIRMTYLFNKLSSVQKNVLLLFIDCSFLAYGALLLWSGLELTIFAWKIKTGVLLISRSTSYSALAVCGALIVIYSLSRISHTFYSFRQDRQGKYPSERGETYAG